MQVSLDSFTHLDALVIDAWDIPSIDQAYGELDAASLPALDVPDTLAWCRRWDGLRRTLSRWRALVDIRFSQNTSDVEASARREAMEAAWPRVLEHDTAIRQALLDHPRRQELEAELGPWIFRRWVLDVQTFRPELAEDLVEESALSAEYSRLIAEARVEFRGETLNLSGLLRFMQDVSRETRHEATRAYWGWFADHGDILDRIYGELVTLRTRMGRAMGHADYIPLGYARMTRMDYSQQHVEVFREAIRTRVVPLAARLRAQQARDLGVETLMLWDEPVLLPQGNPTPLGDEAALVASAQAMFDELSPRAADLFRRMQQGGLLDLATRPGKMAGGYCTDLAGVGLPFIFANFNGTKGDVVVFTHEMGHAFQGWMSRGKRMYDEVWPTMESAEIHSMSLEFLTWPWMERFFGDRAEDFRQGHLRETLLFLTYGTAIDHFQHLVYGQPEADAATRRRWWREMEATYLPWRQAGDVEHVARGGFWHRQGHLYGMAFYYIDYVLAATCALQLWAKAAGDSPGAVSDWERLCALGGEMPFGELLRQVGLRSPFAAGALDAVVARAESVLGDLPD
jgi:M3 family oligoendopeptidase